MDSNTVKKTRLLVEQNLFKLVVSKGNLKITEIP
jgi:hypothetical protein